MAHSKASGETTIKIYFCQMSNFTSKYPFGSLPEAALSHTGPHCIQQQIAGLKDLNIRADEHIKNTLKFGESYSQPCKLIKINFI